MDDSHGIMSDDNDDEPVAVTTYVPAYQRDEWRRAAENLDMSLSEFVRSMVQAGKAGFEETPLDGSHPRGNGLETVIQDVLSSEAMGPDAVLNAITERTKDSLLELRENGTVYQDIDGTLELVDA